MKWLVTGIYGFIGSNFARMLVESGEEVIGVDKVTYAANLKNIEGLGIRVIQRGIENEHAMNTVMQQYRPDIVVNFAAESHVDRSIESATEFVHTNILGVQVLLDLARKYDFKFVQVSTDEVYGSVEQQNGIPFTEDMKLYTNSPYSASKAAADMLVQSYVHTHKVNAMITRCSNNYGPYQNPEKMLPKCILNSMSKKEIPLYGDGKNVRDWIYVLDHCRGIRLVAERAQPGTVYNFGGGCPLTNIELVGKVLLHTGGCVSLIKRVEDRKGHDRTYMVNYDKAADELGWKPLIDFEDGLARTIEWYKEHRDWWKE